MDIKDGRICFFRSKNKNIFQMPVAIKEILSLTINQQF